MSQVLLPRAGGPVGWSIGKLRVERKGAWLSTRPAAVEAGFDELEYLHLNHDVEAAVLRGEIRSGLEHWLKYGIAEGRLLRQPAGLPPDWDEARYLRLNPDVPPAINQGAFASGYHHWQSIGRYEARPGAPQLYSLTPLQDALRQAPVGCQCLRIQRHGHRVGNCGQGLRRSIAATAARGRNADPLEIGGDGTGHAYSAAIRHQPHPPEPGCAAHVSPPLWRSCTAGPVQRGVLGLGSPRGLSGMAQPEPYLS